jgi:hypothetical protein
MMRKVKVRFREYPNGNWQDWSSYLVNAPTISKKIESKNKGEAGLIVFDETNLEFYYEVGNPVYEAFNKDLTSVKRYLFEISALIDGSYIKVYEGQADFSSIEWGDGEKTISFDVLDKLSALNMLTVQLQRGSRKSVLYDVNGDRAVDTISVYVNAAENTDHHKWFAISYLDGSLVKSVTEYNTPALGSTVQSPYDGSKYSFVKFKAINNGKCYLDVVTKDDTYPKSSGNNKTVENLYYYDSDYFGSDIAIKGFNSNYKLKYQDFGSEREIVLSGVEIVAFDGLKIIELLVKKQWPEISVINKSGQSTFPIPLEYFDQLIDEKPFGKQPLEALKFLADTMQCYIFINRVGDLVILKKDSIYTLGTVKNINSTILEGGSTAYFWDKLIDSAKVTAKSWISGSDGEPVEEEVTVSKLQGISPRNTLDKDILVADSSLTSADAIKSYAVNIANDYLNFYGLRRTKLDKNFNLDAESVYLDFTDSLVYNLKAYFFESIEFDLENYEVKCGLVSIDGYEYDPAQVNVPLSREKEILNKTANDIEYLKAELQSVKTKLPYEAVAGDIKAVEVNNLEVEYVDYFTPFEDVKIYKGENYKIDIVYTELKLRWNQLRGDDETAFGYTNTGMALGEKVTSGYKVKDYIVLMFVSRSGLEPEYKYPNTADKNGKWYLLDVVSANAVNGGLAEYIIKNNLELGSTYSFWVGVRYENFDIDKWSVNPLSLPPLFERAGSGLLSRIFIARIGTKNFISSIETTNEGKPQGVAGEGYSITAKETISPTGEKRIIYEAEFDNIRVRNSLSAKELLFQQSRAVNGRLLVSQTGKVKFSQRVNSTT